MARPNPFAERLCCTIKVIGECELAKFTFESRRKAKACHIITKSILSFPCLHNIFVYRHNTTQISKYIFIGVFNICKIGATSLSNSGYILGKHLDKGAHCNKISSTSASNDIAGLTNYNEAYDIFNYLLSVKQAVTFCDTCVQKTTDT